MKNSREEKIKILFGLEATEGGSLKHLIYLTTRLDKKLFEITVIISPRYFKEADNYVFQMREAGARVISIPMLRQINLWKDLSSFIRIYNHINSNKYDIVHAHSSKAGVLFRIAAWLNKVPAIIYTPHCFYFQSKVGIRKFFYCLIERLVGITTNYLVLSNTEKLSALNHKIVGIRKLKSINNAIDFNDYCLSYNSANVKAEMGIDEESIVIGSIGRLVEQKDWLTYIYSARETLRRYSNVIFLIVGDGELSEQLKNKVCQLGLQNKIVITGHCNNISKIYSIIDIYVSTSLWEGLPYVLLEAMWFKKPVIATNLDYENIIYDNENGYLVSIKDYKLLSLKINKLIQNKTLRNSMGENGHHLVKKNFPFEKFVKQHEELYKKCIP